MKWTLNRLHWFQALSRGCRFGFRRAVAVVAVFRRWRIASWGIKLWLRLGWVVSLWRVGDIRFRFWRRLGECRWLAVPFRIAGVEVRRARIVGLLRVGIRVWLPCGCFRSDAGGLISRRQWIPIAIRSVVAQRLLCVEVWGRRDASGWLCALLNSE